MGTKTKNMDRDKFLIERNYPKSLKNTLNFYFIGKEKLKRKTSFIE